MQICTYTITSNGRYARGVTETSLITGTFAFIGFSLNVVFFEVGTGGVLDCVTAGNDAVVTRTPELGDLASVALHFFLVCGSLALRKATGIKQRSAPCPVGICRMANIGRFILDRYGV